MATSLGKSGYLKFSAVTVGELRSYVLNSSSETVDDSVLGDNFRTRKATMKTWSASGEVFWDPLDAGQVVCTIGNSVTVNLYPQGIAASSTYYTGAAIVTQFDTKAGLDSMVEASFAVVGNGALSVATV
jgi:hypothetical protein